MKKCKNFDTCGRYVDNQKNELCCGTCPEQHSFICDIYQDIKNEEDKKNGILPPHKQQNPRKKFRRYNCDEIDEILQRKLKEKTVNGTSLKDAQTLKKVQELIKIKRTNIKRIRDKLKNYRNVLTKNEADKLMEKLESDYEDLEELLGKLRSENIEFVEYERPIDILSVDYDLPTEVVQFGSPPSDEIWLF